MNIFNKRRGLRLSIPDKAYLLNILNDRLEEVVEEIQGIGEYRTKTENTEGIYGMALSEIVAELKRIARLERLLSSDS